MRFLILTDIHGNFEAFQAVLKSVRKKRVDHILFLGDLVGYGASPNEVIHRLQSLRPLSLVRGNHDKAVCGLDSIQTFNPIAAAAITWTRSHITRKNFDYLAALPKTPLTVNDDITICHGAPFDEDYYIFGEFDAAEAFAYFQTPVCFFGHTHFPFVYSERDGNVEGTFLEGDANTVKLERGVKYLINPGSIGQPRDRSNKAAYAVFDSEARTIRFFRVKYDIGEAQRKILEAGLPAALAERLSLGI